MKNRTWPILLLLGWIAAIAYGIGFYKSGETGLPGWNVSDICSSAADPEACNKLELSAKQSVSDTWKLTPAAYRTSCLAELAAAKTLGFQALAKCLQNKTKVAQAAAGGAKGGTSSASSLSAAMSGLLAERASWGTGATAAKVVAPLAAGAAAVLPKSTGPSYQAGPTKDTIAHPANITPPPTLTAVPTGTLASEMAALLKEREGWGTAPGGSGGGDAPTPTKSAASMEDLTKQLLAERATWGTKPSAASSSASASSSAPKSSADLMTALLAEREAWGLPKAKPVAAPLANGAVSPLPKPKGETYQAGKDANTVVHKFVPTPAATTTPVPQDQISKSMSDLLKEREGWGTKPSQSSLQLTNSDLMLALLRERESWGLPKARKVAAPLARGAKSPLPKSKAKSYVAGPGPNTIVHKYVPTPAPKTTAVPQDKIQSEMAALLKEREGWGGAPSAVTAAAAPVSTSDAMAALLKEREGWGLGSAKKVSAPLAAGAVSPLPKSTAESYQAGPGANTIVHKFVATPAPATVPVPQDKIQSEMAALLKESEGWGGSPSLASGQEPAVKKVSSASFASALTALLAERTGWGASPAVSSADNVAVKQPVRVAAAEPATPQVDADACRKDLKGLARSGRIYFESGSAKIQANSDAKLNKVAEIAKRCGDLRIRVEGHTDSMGPAAVNKRISQARAEAVVAYLANAGVSPNRLEAVGYGEARPVASNKSRKSRRKNRRIEFALGTQ